MLPCSRGDTPASAAAPTVGDDARELLASAAELSGLSVRAYHRLEQLAPAPTDRPAASGARLRHDAHVYDGVGRALERRQMLVGPVVPDSRDETTPGHRRPSSRLFGSSDGATPRVRARLIRWTSSYGISARGVCRSLASALGACSASNDFATSFNLTRGPNVSRDRGVKALAPFRVLRPVGGDEARDLRSKFI